MKKSVCLLAVLSGCLLCGCSDLSKNTSGIVDYYSIDVSDLSSSSYSMKYAVTYSKVYRYKNFSTGECVYTDERSSLAPDYYHYDSGKECNFKIWVYEDKYSDQYSEYTYDGFIGYLTKENNYYLDLDNNIIITEVKWSEYKQEHNPADYTEAQSSADNSAAYKCASLNYYPTSSLTVSSIQGKYVYAYSFIREINEKSLERRSYLKFNDNFVIAYQAKWF